MGVRRRARECALQMLFQFDLAKPTLPELLKTYWEELNDTSVDAQEFATNLTLGVIAHLDEVDALIRRRTEHWRISRMAVVDRNLLRLAVYEFLYEAETPKTVVINEALEIARRFSTYEATQFVNGILDGIKRDLEGTEEDPAPLTPQSSSATTA
ncbi:MAG TPA: transcription antitermination factor NusB [Acidobacteriota bacterium]|nr:transcription antitermination factor NusB [Acidobacteriota bacterium]HMZ81668.1 transcription antitermination factor NusB [Acidobacteriota bacterium]HNB70139.1 transcription antitermination factor NusB [Acidobacteriota bacterium]HNC43833.1 transcription antitermination factor NusB [Acidobacteriota bacterium]HND18516.1 transcription antitermination factor NusB [Acidobacteriota bacterium]